jgi:hypothetical protein
MIELLDINVVEGCEQIVTGQLAPEAQPVGGGTGCVVVTRAKLRTAYCRNRCQTSTPLVWQRSRRPTAVPSRRLANATDLRERFAGRPGKDQLNSQNPRPGDSSGVSFADTVSCPSARCQTQS